MSPRSAAPTRTWPHVLAAVPEAAPLGGLTAAPEPAASAITALARTTKRDDETPADLLAAIEYEVSEPATRTALDAMRAWRDEQRRERERLDELAPVDDRPWLEQVIDRLWTATPAVPLAFALQPMNPGTTFDVLVAIGAAGAVLAAGRVAAVQAGRTRKLPEWRGLLLVIAFAMLAAPAVTLGRIAVAGDSLTHGPVTTASLVVQAVAGLLVVALALRAPRAAEHAARRREQRASDPRAPADPRGDFSDDVEDRMDALDAAVAELAPDRLRSALMGRDSGIARGSRATVVDAICVLFERDQIDADEAEWMLREALAER
ncbi:hypothetical protein [Labedella endophytica]|uniref:Uncharacterized protein n=1 Tax=Labedella endophytica TaxID=1523160 RepID=A0A3S0V8S8_9MICO|nr:hypothetical protein [Labedella endophytica]RUQ98176.1 hypothetical protein ELQ94_14235 [Labedella endophytica]